MRKPLRLTFESHKPETEKTHKIPSVPLATLRMIANEMYLEAREELAAISNEMDETEKLADAVNDGMDAYQTVGEVISKSGSLTEDEATIAEEHFRSISRRLGVDQQVFPAVEEFSSKNRAGYATNIGMETFWENVKKGAAEVLKRIIEAVKRFKDFVMGFFKKAEEHSQQMEQKVEEAVKEEKKHQQETGQRPEPVEVDVPDHLASAFKTRNGEPLTAKVVGEYIQSTLGRFHNSNIDAEPRKIAKYIGDGVQNAVDGKLDSVVTAEIPESMIKYYLNMSNFHMKPGKEEVVSDVVVVKGQHYAASYDADETDGKLNLHVEFTVTPAEGYEKPSKATIADMGDGFQKASVNYGEIAKKLGILADTFDIALLAFEELYSRTDVPDNNATEIHRRVKQLMDLSQKFHHAIQVIASDAAYLSSAVFAWQRFVMATRLKKTQEPTS